MRNPKLIGERAECAFMFQALERGLAVSKPFGDSCAYDVVVDNGKRLLRVQVRCAIDCRPLGKYRVFRVHAIRPGSRQLLTKHEVDFIAARAAPCDAWYIIPIEAVQSSTDLCLWPHIPNSRGRFERYKEAWNLLAESGK